MLFPTLFLMRKTRGNSEETGCTQLAYQSKSCNQGYHSALCFYSACVLKTSIAFLIVFFSLVESIQAISHCNNKAFKHCSHSWTPNACCKLAVTVGTYATIATWWTMISFHHVVWLLAVQAIVGMSISSLPGMYPVSSWMFNLISVKAIPYVNTKPDFHLPS